MSILPLPTALRRGLLLVAAAILAGCGATTPAPTATRTPTPSASQAPTSSSSRTAQRAACGTLDAATCAEAIARVTAQVPSTGQAEIAVAATRDPAASIRPDAVVEILVAFSPDAFAGQDLWLGTPTWIVTLGPQAEAVSVEPWRETRLPDAFVELLRQNGIAA